VCFKEINDPRFKRHLRPDYCKRNATLLREREKIADGSWRYHHDLSARRNSRIAGRAKHLGNTWRARESPTQRMFPSATSNNKNLHIYATRN
jgi:hypothetical protein